VSLNCRSLEQDRVWEGTIIAIAKAKCVVSIGAPEVEIAWRGISSYTRVRQEIGRGRVGTGNGGVVEIEGAQAFSILQPNVDGGMP
jgi:hypothetical protein